MKNSEEAIERVLAGLRDVEAPAGMERRVLAAMEARAAARSGWRWGLALACGVAAVVVVGALMLRPARVRMERVAAVHAPVAVPVRVEKVQRRNTEILSFSQNDANVGGGRKVRRMEVAEAAKIEQERGFPAPPMPLTEEEKLLLRVAHRMDPRELTPLNAEARERQEAEFDEEFMEFFRVPVMAEEETNPIEGEKGDAR
jgi:hypothetical protein